MANARVSANLFGGVWIGLALWIGLLVTLVAIPHSSEIPSVWISGMMLFMPVTLVLALPLHLLCAWAWVRPYATGRLRVAGGLRWLIVGYTLLEVLSVGYYFFFEFMTVPFG